MDGNKVINPKVTGKDGKTDHPVKYGTTRFPSLRKTRTSLFRLCSAQHGSRPAVCFRQVQGQERSRFVQGRNDEVDWSVGQIMKALRKNWAEKDTLFMFPTSDNGGLGSIMVTMQVPPLARGGQGHDVRQ